MSAEIIIGSVVLAGIILGSLGFGLVSLKQRNKHRNNSSNNSPRNSPRSSPRSSPRHSSEIDAAEEKEAIDYLKRHDYNLGEGK